MQDFHPDLRDLDKARSPYTFVDCQGFAGGFTAGAALTGMRLVAKREGPRGFGVPLLEANRGGFLPEEWSVQMSDPSEWEPVKADVVIGTPPCTAFSNMSAGFKQRGGAADINHCMWDLIEYAARCRPAAVMMESVAQAYTNGLELMRALAARLIELTGVPYLTTHVLQNNLSVGGCTNRARYFLVLSQVPLGVERVDLRWLPTVGDALGDLRDLDLTWEDQPLTLAPTHWSRGMRTRDHRVDGHMTPAGGHNRRLHDLTAAEGGVEWKPGEREADVLRRYYDKHGRLPDSWRYEYRGLKHQGDGPRPTREEQLLERNLDPGGFGQVRRWRWDQPGHVINGAGPHMVWHPDNRVYTHREVARLLGFPDTWMVGSARDQRSLTAYWGKGTSVHPARWVSHWLKQSLDGSPGSIQGDELPDGSRVIDVRNDWRPVARRQWGSTRIGAGTGEDGTEWEVLTDAAVA